MFIRSLFYFLGEALKSILRNGWMSVASIAVVSITLLILGSFMILNYNVAMLTEDIKEQIQIVLYVDDQATKETRETLQSRLVAHPKLGEVRFVSREEALERLKRRLGDRAYLLEGLEAEGENPLRDSYELRTVVPEDVSMVAKEIMDYPGVDYVDYGSGVVEPLFQFTGVLRWVGLIFMVGLAITAVFLIAHTIRLTVFIRRNEIMIMKYVGATNWFIRWPFLFEGLFLGLIGALIPVVIIYYSYQVAAIWMENHIFFISLLAPAEVISEVTKVLLPLGVVLGMLGSCISIRRFLKV
ncbi:MAG: permease-like cell division protein FtsX [Dethiobacteria bacterium]|jgi:cell division transport system permease protein